MGVWQNIEFYKNTYLNKSISYLLICKFGIYIYIYIYIL